MSLAMKRFADSLPNLDVIVRGVLCIYLISLPFKALLVIERNSFIILLALLVLWCAINRRHFLFGTPFDVPLLAFVGWVALTIPFAIFPEYSVKEFGKLLQQMVIFYAVIFFFRERSARRQLIYLLIGQVLLVSLYGLTQVDRHNSQAVVSFLPAEVWLTTYLVLFTPVFLAFAYFEQATPSKMFYTVGGILASACLVLTQSRAGLLALFCELWILAWLLRRRFTLIVAAGFTVTFLLVALLFVRVETDANGNHYATVSANVPIRTSLGSVIHRFDIWAFTMTQIPQHIWIGIGYGKDNFKLVYGDEPEEVRPGHAGVKNHGTHNILLYLALHVGLPGALLFVWLFVSLVRRLIQEFRQSERLIARGVLLGTAVGTCGLGVRLMFDQMFVGTLAIQFWVLVAAAVLHFGPQCHTADEKKSIQFGWGYLLKARSAP
ncbi:MAG: O-antigen ligase family protein [Nitrospiraceae bacterium]